MDALDSLEDIGIAVKLLGNYRPRRKFARRWLSRSAVGLYLNESPDDGVSVLMIKRAQRAGDPWSGHMAFPGGRRDREDRNTLATAKRETREEIGLDADAHARLIGRLSDVMTHPRLRTGPMIITPYLFRLHARPPLSPNHEVDEIVWVPLRFLADRSNRQKMRWAPNGVPIELPCYLYRERRIWGLSLMMLDELLAALL
jgi:8-oxo-dGTP pyrophosphatase MutT (NUDIX family)